MANDLKLTFSTGALSNLPSTFKAGQVLFAIDENNKGYIYFDKNSSTRVLMGSDSTYAEKANKDSNGNVIVSTYLTNLQGVKNTAETEYIIQGVRGDGSAPFNTSAVIPISLLSSENKTGTKLFLIGTTSQSSKGIVGYSNGNIYITTGNKLHANLEGKADTAAVADTANAIEWSKITSKPQLVEGFDGSSENNGYKIQLYNTSGSPIPAANTALNGTITIPFASANSIGLMSTDDQHFSGIKRFDDGINVEDLVPIESHTYTDVIGSANNNAGAGFFYAKVRGKTYNGVWHIKVRVKATVPSNANYETLSYFDLWGTANTYIAYKCQNAIKSTSYRPIYYHSYFRINQNGYNADLGGWLGFNLIYSANPTNTSFKRTVTIDLLMYENCDVEFVSTLLEPADIPNVTVTGNYSSSTTSYDNFDCCNNGLRETGDDNDTTTMVSLYNRFMAGAGGLMRYSLAMRDTTGRWQSFTTGTGGNSNTPKSKNTAKFIMGDIVYLSMGSDVANGNLIGTSVVRHYQSLIDYRYSTNAGSATLVANKTVYIVGTVDEDGLFSLDDTWWTQDLPTTEDGKVYIPLGVVNNDSSTYRCDFSGWHTPLIYRNGKIVSYTDTIDISHTTGTLPVHRGGTGRVSFTAGELLMGNGSDALSSVAKTSANTANTVVYRDANGNFSAGTITANLTGTATKATQDSAGQQINTTYIKGLSISGTTLTITKGNGGTSTLTLQDFDTKVGMIARGTTKAYVLGTITTPTDSNQNITSVAETGVYFDTVAGQLVATNFKGNLIGNADTATKATKDSANQQINTTYIKGLSASSVTITVTKGDGSTSTFDIGALPLSGGTMTGNILAGGTQSLGSTSNPFHNLVLGGTTSATMTNASTNPRITFQEGTGTQPVHLIYSDYDNYRSPAGLKVVGGASATPAWFEVEGNVYAAAFKGNADSATKATQDSAGQQINTTYIKGLSVSGKTITITKGDGSTSTITTQDTNTDTKVNVKLATTTKAYLLATSTIPTSSNQAVESVADSGVYLDTTEGTLAATIFKGALQGNADTATKATGDSAGQQINTTYIKGLSVSGTTITITKGDGSTSTITTQDTNTDTKVNVTLNTTAKAYLLATTTTPTSTAQGVTSIADTGVYLDTTAGTLVATKFKGNLEGNADTATNATNDSNGSNIRTTYIKSITINGKTLTYQKGDGGNTNLTITNSTYSDYTTLLKPIASTTTASTSSWNIPAGSKQVWGERFSDTTLQYTPSGGSATTITDTGDWVMWLTPNATSNAATLNMRIDGTYYGSFSGNLTGNASTATNATNDASGNNIKSYYAHSLSGTHTSTNKNEYKLTLANTNGTALSTVTLPLATDSQAGLLSFANQTIKGIKTFSTGIVAKTDNDFISHSNEFNFAPALSANMEIHINHRTAGTNTNSAKITKYHFKDGNGQYTVIKASSFEGTVDWSNIGSKPQAVEGAVGTKATDKYTIQLYDLAGGAIAANTATPAKNGVIVIPAASTTDAGLVTTGTQTFTGAKTFNTSIGTPTLTVTGTGGLNYSGIQNGTTNVARVVWFADASYKGKPVYHTDFTYNPATGELKAGKFTSSGTMSGTALTLSLGDDSMHSTEDATLKVTGGASISERLSAKMIRIDNGVADATKGFNLIYNSTEECLEFQFGN